MNSVCSQCGTYNLIHFSLFRAHDGSIIISIGLRSPQVFKHLCSERCLDIELAAWKTVELSKACLTPLARKVGK